MIRLIEKGAYRLVTTTDKMRVLYLGDQGYLWSYAKGIGDLLSFSRHPHKPRYVLARGDYRIYEVEKEADYVDLQHMELSLGPRAWQGYLLLTGLPTTTKIRSRIVPTDEVIGSRRITK